MKPFHELLETSAAAHGHLCPGQVVGVRMAMLGCRLIGLDEPSRRDQIKKLIVYVEMDRCTADAVAHVTGVKLGRRSLKFADYGIMAATFLNLATGKAFRVVSTEEARDLAMVYAPGTGADQAGRSARPDPAQGYLPQVRAGRPRRA
jgi:formylmethanofuran dehydrogenase subunit E